MKRYVLIFVLIIGLITLLTGCDPLLNERNTAYYDNYNDYTVNYETINIIERNKTLIYSLEDNFITNNNFSGSLNGGFILGIGAINGTINGQTDVKLYYFIMKGDNEKGYVVAKYDVTEVRIFPEDNITQAYYIEKYSQYLEKRNYPNGKTKEIKHEKLTSKELHLPKGYIKQNYNIDMK